MILITEFMADEAVETLRSKHKTHYNPELADVQEQLPEMMPGVSVLIVRNRTQVTEALLDASPDLLCVGRLGVGLDNIDQAACAQRNITVYPAVGANNLSVAEYVITSAMVLLRHAYFSRDEMQAGKWPRQACAGREISGKRLGLVGFGAIAQHTAKLAHGIGMEVSAFDPFLPDDNPAWKSVEKSELEPMLASSDVVSLHTPLTADTQHLIDADRLALMQSDAILINAARGGVVDENALAEALRSFRLGGAALDVFEDEPLSAEAAQRFAGISNVLLTPHIGGVTVESNVRVSSMIADVVMEHLAQSG